MAQQLHEAEPPYAELEINDYEELKSTKVRLDKARQEVDNTYEALSRCHLNNMTYAKAQLDQARQKEKECFEDFERAHNQLVKITSRLVRAKTSTGAPSTDELEDDADTSSLGRVPRERPRRIRAPTRASARSALQVDRRDQSHDDSNPTRDDSRTCDARSRRTSKVLFRQTVNRRVPNPLKHPPFHICPILGSRAVRDARFKALLETIATGKAPQDQRDEFQRHVDEINARNLKAGYDGHKHFPKETPSDQTLCACICLQFL